MNFIVKRDYEKRSRPENVKTQTSVADIPPVSAVTPTFIYIKKKITVYLI